LKRLVLIAVALFTGILTTLAQCEVDAGEDVVICEGEAVTIGGNPTVVDGNNPVVTWNMGADDVDNPVVSPNNTTTYTVTLNSNGCTDTDQITVTVLDSPTANFTWNPDGECGGTTVDFNSTSTGSDLDYDWNFDDPGGNNTSSQEDPSHTFNPIGDGTSTFNVTLTVTDDNGCQDSVTETVTILEAPDAVLSDPITNFINCDGSDQFSLSVLDASTPAANAEYTIDWGDGSAVWVSGTAPVLVNHVYDGLGVWTLTYTVEGANGCISTQVTDVANVTNPAIGAGTTGNTTVCGPVELCFTLSLFESNHESTTYTVDFGDGSPTETFNHPPPDEVCHTYSLSSCEGGVPYTFSVLANNVCSFSEGTISPIVIYSPPTAAFEATPIPQCVNVPVTFLNLSDMGYYTNCTENGLFTWDFGDASPLVVSLSNDDQSHAYSDPGTYTVTLTAQNACNNDNPAVFTQEVCIEEPPVVDFVADPVIGCTPLEVPITNNSLIGDVCSITYDWQVTTTLLECTPSNPNFQYINGTSASDAEPELEFLSPGLYQLSLTMENSCGIFQDLQDITVMDIPEVDVLNLANICEGESASPSAIVEDCLSTITSYEWTFESGSPATSGSLNPGSVNYSTDGTWDITLEVENACGIGSDATTITVEAAPDVTITSSAGLELCANASTILTANGANTYTWTFDPTLSTTSGPVTTATPGTSTTYTVTGYTPAGCPGTESITIDVNPLPIVTPAAAYEICAGESVVIGADVNGGEPPYDNYNWSPNDGSLDQTDIANPEATPASTTNYNVSVSDDNGCSGIGTVPVVVNPLPIVSAGPDTQLCNQPVGEQLVGSPIPGAGETGTWSGPNITPDGIFTPTGTGFFDVTYTFTDASGCTNSDVVTIEVIDPTTADAGPDLEFCEGPNTVLLVAPTPGGIWSGPNVLPDGTFTPTPAGDYALTYAIGGGSCLSEDFIDIEVLELPQPDAGVDEVICEGDSIQLNGSVSGGEPPYSTILWTPGATLSDDDILDPWASPASSQSYTLSITDDNSCVNTAAVTVNVNTAPIVEAGPDIELCNQPIPEQLVGFSPIPGVGENGEWTGPNIDTDGLFTPTGPGSFVVTYTFTDAAGCEASDSLTVLVVDPTVANAGPDFDACLNDPDVQLSQPGTWSGPNVTPDGVFSPVATGDFDLTFTIGSGTCLTEDDLTITVNELPVADAAADETICEGDSVQLMASGMSPNMPIQLFSWSGGTGLSATDIEDPWASPTTDQTYNLTVVDDAGCAGSDQVTVFVNALPVIDAGADLTLCDQNIPEILTGFDPIDGEWTGPGITDPSGEFTSPGEGVYTVYLEYTDANTCFNLDSIEITVIEPVVADAGPDQVLCLNNGIYQLQGFDPLLGITWSGPGIVDDELGLFDPTLTGDGTFNLTIEFGAGTCYTIDDMDITVDPLPVVDAGPDEAICGNNDPVDLTGNSPLGGTWEGLGIIDAVTGTFDPSLGVDNYDVFYWYTDPVTGCADTSYMVVSVSPVPVSDFTVAPLGCTDAPADLVNSSSGETEWYWDFGNNDSSDEENPMYVYPDEGFFDIELLVTNEYGCQDSLTLNNEIIDPPSPSLALSPNEGCAPLTVSFTNNSVGQYLEYEWDLAITTTLDFEPVDQIYDQGDDVLNYPISLSATNFCGTVLDLDTIVVFPQPVAGFGTNLDEFCSPFTVEINNTSVGNPDIWDWDFGDGTGSAIEEPGSHIYYTDSIPTDYTITLITTNECGIDTAEYTITVLPNTVTAFFNANVVEGCTPLEVEFTDFSEGGTEVSYDFGDDDITDVWNPTHIFTDDGVYNVCQYVDNGCSFDTTCTQITVLPSPVLDFITDVPNVCQDQAVQFINLSEDVADVNWDFGDGFTSEETNPIHFYEDGGSYTVTLTGISLFNECPAEIQQSFTVHPTPVAGFTVPDQVGCSPFTVDFTNTTEGGNFYQWDFGDDNTDNGANVSNTFFNDTADPMLFTVVMVAENLQLCTDTFEFDIIVSPTPQASFDLSAYESCYAPLEVQVTNNSIFADGYDWNFGLAGTSTDVNPSFTAEFVGTYDISLTASNAYGCEDEATSTFTVHPLPEANFGSDVQDGCVDLLVNFDNQSNGALDYIWDFGDGSQSFVASPLHEYGSPGIYDVSLIAITDQGCSDTLFFSEYIEAYNLPWAQFSFDPEETTIYQPVIQFYDESFDAATWSWTFGDGQGSTLQHPEHIYNLAGTYVITLNVWNEHGCASFRDEIITIEDAFNFYVPNAFTPDNDGINDAFFPQMVGIGLIEFYEFKIFDRWGIKVFETNDPTEPWIGDFRGHGDYFVQDDVYVWQAKLRLKGAEESRFYFGHVTQVR
jgi:PKD repeat protein